MAKAVDQVRGEGRGGDEERQFEPGQKWLPFQIPAKEEEGCEQSRGVKCPRAIARGRGVECCKDEQEELPVVIGVRLMIGVAGWRVARTGPGSIAALRVERERGVGIDD